MKPDFTGYQWIDLVQPWRWANEPSIDGIKNVFTRPRFFEGAYLVVLDKHVEIVEKVSRLLLLSIQAGHGRS